jgi:serine/threonine protein kinase
MGPSNELTSLVPFPPAAGEKYIPVKHLQTSREGTIYICVASKPSSSDPDSTEAGGHELFAVKVFRELHIRTPLQITLLNKLKTAQNTLGPNHPSNRYFPKFYEIHDPHWQSMEAIEGATLEELLPIIRNDGTWGAVFTCHLFNGLHAALSCLLDMGLTYIDLSTENTMFRYKVGPGLNEFPRLMLVDFNLWTEQNDSTTIGLTTNAILGLCSEVCNTGGSRAYPITTAAELSDEPTKPRAFARIKAYSSGESDDKSSANRKKSLIDPYDVETMKEFDQCLDAPLDCELDLVALGRKFRDATEGVVGKSLNVPDWPTGDLEQLLKRSLVPDVEIEQGLHARLLG